MKTYLIRLFVLLAFTSILSGCGPRRPEKMPSTAPCTITVLKDGVPFPEVEVLLYWEGGNGAMNIHGLTDSQGVAKITSSWGEYSTGGAPVGKSKVTIMKHFVVPDALTAAQIERLSLDEQAKYEKKLTEQMDKLRPIPKEDSSVSSTPYEVDVQPKTGATLKIEVK